MITLENNLGAQPNLSKSSCTESDTLNRIRQECTRVRAISTATIYRALPKLTEIVSMSAAQLPALPSIVAKSVTVVSPLYSFLSFFKKPVIDDDVMAQIILNERIKMGTHAADGRSIQGQDRTDGSRNETQLWSSMDDIVTRSMTPPSGDNAQSERRGGSNNQSGKKEKKISEASNEQPKRMRADDKIKAEDALLKQLNSGEISSRVYAEARKALNKR